MAQYFTYDPAVQTDLREFTCFFGMERFAFVSDAGLFSHGQLDAQTAVLLDAIPPLAGSLLDLGCAWGAVGIILARQNKLTDVTLSDINPHAVELARENCKTNGIPAQVVLSDAFENISRSFDTIVLNPPIHAGKAAVERLLAGAAAHLHAGGVFYLVIHKKHGAAGVQKRLQMLFGNCETLLAAGGLFVFACRNVQVHP